MTYRKPTSLGSAFVWDEIYVLGKNEAGVEALPPRNLALSVTRRNHILGHYRPYHARYRRIYLG